MLNQTATVHYEFNDHKQLSVTSVEAQFTAPTAYKGRPSNIFVQALSANTKPIFIIKTGGANGGAGYELPAGANMSIPSTLYTELYAITESGTQKLNITYNYGVI